MTLRDQRGQWQWAEEYLSGRKRSNTIWQEIEQRDKANGRKHKLKKILIRLKGKKESTLP